MVVMYTTMRMNVLRKGGVDTITLKCVYSLTQIRGKWCYCLCQGGYVFLCVWFVCLTVSRICALLVVHRVKTCESMHIQCKSDKAVKNQGKDEWGKTLLPNVKVQF